MKTGNPVNEIISKKPGIENHPSLHYELDRILKHRSFNIMYAFQWDSGMRELCADLKQQIERKI